MNDPVVIAEYRRAKNTVNVYGDLFANGKPVVVGVVMRMNRSGNGIITTIRTVHERSNFAKQIDDTTVLYLNENKKRTRSWFQVCGNLTVPLEGTKFGFIRSISFEDEDVKEENPNLRLKGVEGSRVETIDVKERDDGSFVYSYHAEKQKEGNQLLTFHRKEKRSGIFEPKPSFRYVTTEYRESQSPLRYD